MKLSINIELDNGIANKVAQDLGYEEVLIDPVTGEESPNPISIKQFLEEAVKRSIAEGYSAVIDRIAEKKKQTMVNQIDAQFKAQTDELKKLTEELILK